MATQLVKLQDVERLSERVIRILGGNPGKFTLQGTNTYIVGTGRQRILVDTGEGNPVWIASLKEVLKKENAVISQAIITHWHHDHQGGIRDLLDFSPTTIIYKSLPADGQRDIVDGDNFQVDGASLQAVSSPGHTQDHISLLLREEDAMFTGDNVLGHGTAVFENLSAYLGSLEKMGGKFGARAYPGHGQFIEDGPGKIREYIQHRQQREDQVLQVLKGSTSSLESETTSSGLSAWASMEIVKIIYKDVSESLHVPANGGVMQILRKLEQEEKVVEDSKTEKWRLRRRSIL